MCILGEVSVWGGKRQRDEDVAESHTVHFPGTDNTAAVHTQHVGFNRQEQDVFLLPILVVDSGPPTLSSTGTLTIRICGCDSSGTIQSCNTTAFVMAASLSPGALIALLVCVLILVGESKSPPPPPPRDWTLVFCLDRPHPRGGASVSPTYR